MPTIEIVNKIRQLNLIDNSSSLTKNILQMNTNMIMYYTGQCNGKTNSINAP